MMTHKETDEWSRYAKDLAKAERELAVEHWVCISFEIQTGAGQTNIPLHRIDLPRDMLDRWRWVISWRHAKLVCRHPRKTVWTYYAFYDKRTGLETGFGSLLSRLAAAKAQVTKVQRRIAEYIAYNRSNNLFFREETDEQLIKAGEKLKQKELIVEQMLARLKEEVEQHKKTDNGHKRAKPDTNQKLPGEARVTSQA